MMSVYPIPDDVKARLRKNESNQRSRAKALNKKIIARNNKVKEAHQLDLIIIEKVDIVQTLEDQEMICACHMVHGHDECFKFVDVLKTGAHKDAPVIAHLNNLDNGGHHTKDNVTIMRHECNMAISHSIEKKRSAKTERVRRTHSGVKKNGDPYLKKKKKAIPARPEGLKSRSKWPDGKSKWPKRKFGQ